MFTVAMALEFPKKAPVPNPIPRNLSPSLNWKEFELGLDVVFRLP